MTSKNLWRTVGPATLVILTTSILPGCGRGEALPSAVEPVVAERELTQALAGVPPFPDVAPDDWPWWRGPNQDARAEGPIPPLEWSETENVIWRATVPGSGHGTPIVCGERIFLPTADELSETQRLVCYNRASGELEWDTLIHQGGFMRKHRKNSHASATPACDGQHVYLPFMVEKDGQAGIWVTATDLQGNIVWQRSAGPFTSQHGYGSSPVLYKSMVIVAGDNRETGFLAALDGATGEIRWRIKRPAEFSFATPIVAQISGRPQLVIHGAQWVISYDPDNGSELWRARGPAQVCANSITFDVERVYVSGGYPEKELLAIRADGEGDVSDSHVLWRTSKAASYVPSMLVDGGRLYSVSDQGIATCYDVANGAVLWQKRLGGNYSASPTLAGGLLWIPSESGEMVIYGAGDQFEIMARNDLGDGGFASPVVAGGHLYLRTDHYLYCIGEQRGG